MSSIYYSEKINRWWKTRSLNQKVKKDEAVSATTKIVCPEANTESAAPQVKPELPLPVMYFLVPKSLSSLDQLCHFDIYYLNGTWMAVISTRLTRGGCCIKDQG